MRYRDHAAFMARFDEAPPPLPVHGPPTLREARHAALIDLLHDAWDAGSEFGGVQVSDYAYGEHDTADVPTFEEWLAEESVAELMLKVQQP